jgi:methionyl-tRNA formyltransferase
MGLSILYLGMAGSFSLMPLRAMLAAGFSARAIIVPSAGYGDLATGPVKRLDPPAQVSELPLLTPYLQHNIVHLGWQQHIPVFEVARIAASKSLSLLHSLKPDIAVVACYPQILPDSVLALAPMGFINVHPSLLPNFRGPDPLFWAFREGISVMGVSLHLMDSTADTGPIVKQARLVMPDGISGPEADRVCGELGGKLLVEALGDLSRGELRRSPQPSGGSYHPAPGDEDFGISLDWSARRAFNFMRATADRGKMHFLEIGRRRVTLVEAVGHRPERAADQPLVVEGEIALIRFSQGVLRARVGTSAKPAGD